MFPHIQKNCPVLGVSAQFRQLSLRPALSAINSRKSGLHTDMVHGMPFHLLSHLIARVFADISPVPDAVFSRMHVCSFRCICTLLLAGHSPLYVTDRMSRLWLT